MPFGLTGLPAGERGAQRPRTLQPIQDGEMADHALYLWFHYLVHLEIVEI